MLPDVLPEAYVAHSSPSRMRIRVPAKKGGTAYFAWLRDQLLSLPGITTVEVNPLTGSVLVVGDVAGGDIREFARVNGLFRFHSAGTAVKPLERVITGGIRQVDLSIRSYTGGQLDLSSLIFLYLAGAGNLPDQHRQRDGAGLVYGFLVCVGSLFQLHDGTR